MVNSRPLKYQFSIKYLLSPSRVQDWLPSCYKQPIAPRITGTTLSSATFVRYRSFASRMNVTGSLQPNFPRTWRLPWAMVSLAHSVARVTATGDEQVRVEAVVVLVVAARVSGGADSAIRGEAGQHVRNRASLVSRQRQSEAGGGIISTPPEGLGRCGRCGDSEDAFRRSSDQKRRCGPGYPEPPGPRRLAHAALSGLG